MRLYNQDGLVEHRAIQPSMGKGAEMNHESIYRNGIAATESSLGADCRDYDRVLGGLAAVLAAEGVVLSPQELSGLFHDPLATWDVRKPFGLLAHALDILALPGKPSYNEERVLGRRMTPYLPYVDEGELVDEKSLGDRLAELGRRREGLNRDLDECVPSFVATYNGRAEIVEALLGETDAVVRALARAGSLEHAATWMRARMREEVARVEQRIKDLPVERARANQPLSALKLRPSSFEGNTAPTDSPYISDHATILHKAAIPPKRADKLTAKVPPSHRAVQADGVVEKVYAQALHVVGAADKLDILGWFSCRSRIGRGVVARNVAVGVDHAGDLVYFDADKLRWVHSLTRFDEVRARLSWAGYQSRRYAAWSAAVLLRDGVEVGVLMPLRENKDTLPFDVEEARQAREERKATS